MLRVLVFALVCWALTAPSSAAASFSGILSGTVIDATTGVPLPDVQVRLVDSTRSTRTGPSGHFTLADLAAGTYRIWLTREGYQPAVSEPLPVRGGVQRVTLAMQQGTNALQIIAVTSSRGSDTLQQSSTFSKTLNIEQLQRYGIVRAADALRTEPGVNNGITGDTAALADDVNVSIRGIGTLETVAAIDGHPIAYGIKGGFNYQLSPVYPYRNIAVLYGSGGSDLVGVNAIGGVINFQTLDAAPHEVAAFTQGAGTFDQRSTAFTAAGTSSRLGYAVALGVSSLDGPFDNDAFYQTGAAYDQSAPAGPVRDLGVYLDDSLAVTRADLVKLQYRLGSTSSLTLTSVGENRWVDKTGNGDGDYLDYAPALAFGEQLLAQYKPANFPGLPACPGGTFVATNANGQPNGYAPNGKPDGGVTCQTPQQYAQFNTGWDGAGPSWQSLKLNDDALDYRVSGYHALFRIGLFESGYANLVDRTFQLPELGEPLATPFEGNDASWSDFGVNETGTIVSDDLLYRNDDVEFGNTYTNNTYFTYGNGDLKGAPVITETAYFLRDAYHPENSPLTAYLNLWAKRSTATHTSYLDSRLSAVYKISPHDQVRVSAGSTTTQPSANMLGETFIASALGGAGGGAPISCSGLDSIGSAPSSLLRPEDGVDEDAAYVHRWQGDTQMQLTLYDTNVFDKLYSTIVPLAGTGGGFVPPAFLAQATAAVAGKCGAATAPSLLGVTGNFNVGTLRARGADLSGRYRANRRLYFDYDYSLTSTVLLAANSSLLQRNLTLIDGSQLPRLPLHAFNGSIDYTFGDGLDARYTLYTVSANNTKSLPPYDDSNLSLSYPAARGCVVTGTVLNLFDQWGSIAGLRYEGVPLPLNAYAKPGDYAQYIGASATEQFGLPPRAFYVSVQESI